MDENAAQFWASVVGALVGGLIAAVTAVALFVAERKAAAEAREQESLRQSARAQRDLANKVAEETERLLDAVDIALMDLWVDDSDPTRATDGIRRLKSIARRASAAVKPDHPGAAAWLSKLHYAAALRSASYILIARKPEADKTPVEQFASASHNGWMNTQHDLFVSWRIGDATDGEMLDAAAALSSPSKPSPER